MSRNGSLAETFVRLAQMIDDERDPDAALRLLPQRCLGLLGDVVAVALSYADHCGKTRVAVAAGDPELREGARVLQTEYARTLTEPGDEATSPCKPSWRHFLAAARRTGFDSAHVLTMRRHDTVIGALTLFGSGPGALGEHDVALAQALADVAVIGVLQRRATERQRELAVQLQGALSSRVVIEQAKGLIAGRDGVSLNTAFETMRSYARAHNLRVHELAAEIVSGSAGLAARPDHS